METGDTKFAKWSDGRLLGEFARTGSAGAFEEVVRRHGGAVLGVCRRVLGDGHLAEDAAQAVLLTMAQKAGSLREHASVIGWLQKVAWYVALRAREAGAIRRAREQEAAAMRGHDMSQANAVGGEGGGGGEWEELRPVLDVELAGLPERYRLPLMLHYLEGRTLEEAAKLLHVKMWTVAGQVRRGRELLRGRLARRGVVLPVTVLAGLLVGEAAARAAPASLMASTVQAATLLAAGKAAAGSVVSLETAALVKGTVHMLMLAKLKAAALIAVAAILPVAAVVTTWQMAAGQLGGPPPVSWSAPVPPVPKAKTAEVRAKIVLGAPVDWAQVQTDALAKKLDVLYRRATLAEVVDDLEARSHVRVAYPRTLGRWPSLDVAGKGVTVRAALEQVAAAGKWDADFRPEYVVFTQKADDAVLAGLKKKLAGADRWEKLQAMWDLGELADPRIYPLLAKTLGDADAGVKEWGLRILAKHARMAPTMGDAEKAAIAQAAGAWLATEAAKKENPYDMKARALLDMWYLNRAGAQIAQARQERLDLLAGTGRPEALAALGSVVEKGPNPTMRTGAAAALGNMRVGAKELVEAFPAVEAEYRDLDEAVNGALAAWRESFKAGKPVALDVPPMYHTMLSWVTMTRQAALWSLVKLHNASVTDYMVAEYKAAQAKFLDMQEGDALLAYWGERASLDLTETTRSQQLWTQTPGLADWAKKTAMGSTVTPELMIQDKMVRAAGALNQTQDGKAAAEVVKLFNDPQRLGIICGALAGTREGRFAVVDDAALVAAMLKHIQDGGAVGEIMIRSLGASHDPKVADALIEQTKSADVDRAVGAATALARTRDPRALGVIAGMLKRAWPDWEKEDRAAQEAIQKEAATQPMPDFQAIMRGEAKAPAWGSKPFRLRINATRVLVRALLETRDPKLLDTLVELAQAKGEDAAVSETARLNLVWAVGNAGDLDKLLEVTKKLSVVQQHEVLNWEYRPNPGWNRGVTPPWWAADGRFVELLRGRVADDEALGFGGNKYKPQNNQIIDVLDLIMAPSAEKAVAELCQHEDQEGVADFAKRALGLYGDPGVKQGR